VTDAAGQRRRTGAAVSTRAWGLHRVLIMLIAVAVGVVVVIDAAAGPSGGEQAVFSMVAAGGALAGAISALRLASVRMVDDHDPFVPRERGPLAGTEVVPCLLADALYAVAVMLVAGVVCAAVDPSDAGGIIAFPLLWVLGSLPGVVFGALASLVFGIVRDVARGRGTRRSAGVNLLVAMLFTSLVAGLVCAALSIRVEEGARLRRSMLWVLFGGYRDGISVIDGALPWIARFLLVAALGILLALILWSVAASRRSRSRRAPESPKPSREDRARRRRLSPRRAYRRSLEPD
jgi:hypothetical protein